MPSMLSCILERLPKPFVPLLPAAVTFLVGLVIWLIAWYIPVNFPQETAAPYIHESQIAKVHHPSVPATAIASADKTQHPGLQ